MVEIWDPKVFDELKTLRSCFDPRKPLTAVLCGAAKDVEGATFSSFAFTRGEFWSKIEHVALISVGEGSGPWLPKARKVEMTKGPQVQRKTVRIAAPACFRAPWLGASTKDIPTQVIQTLVGLTQVSASEFLRRQMDRAGKAQSRMPACDLPPLEGLFG